MAGRRQSPLEDHKASLAELVPFPSSSPAGEDLEPAPDEDVAEAELVPADDEEVSETGHLLDRGGELVPTGQVPDEVILEGEIVEPSSVLDRRFEPRPIVPAWVLDRAQRRTVVRWFARHVGHTTAFHAVRLPKYALRAVAYSPRGLSRAVASLVRWVLDAEARPLARSAIEHGEVAGYLALSRQSAARLRARLWATGVVLVVLVLALVVGKLLWPATLPIAAAVAVPLRVERPPQGPSVRRDRTKLRELAGYIHRVALPAAEAYQCLLMEGL